MMKVIKFYKTSDEYGCFSNFAAYPIQIDGKVWPTSEHYFQAQKFLDTQHKENIRQAKSPMIAAKMGRDRSKALRENWDNIKDGIMLKAVRTKFAQHEDIAKTLIMTGNALIVEHTGNDSYWGDGGHGKGKNKLGQILMIVREELKVNMGDLKA